VSWGWRIALALGIAALLLVVLAVAIHRDDGRCPEGQAPVLSDSKWVCVKEGG
jgi:hypothetical protein